MRPLEKASDLGFVVEGLETECEHLGDASEAIVLFRAQMLLRQRSSGA
jgi:hypothetical protein